MGQADHKRGWYPLLGTVKAPGADPCMGSRNPAPRVKMGDPQSVHVPMPGSGTAPRLTCYPTRSRGNKH